MGALELTGIGVYAVPLRLFDILWACPDNLIHSGLRGFHFVCRSSLDSVKVASKWGSKKVETSSRLPGIKVPTPRGLPWRI